MTLYEITEDFARLLALAEDPETDPDVLADTMEAITGDFDAKADGYAMVIAQLTAEADAVKKEADRLATRRKALQANADRIKKALETAMVTVDRRKFKTTLFSFNIQKNPPRVVIDADPWEIPVEYTTIPDPVVDTAKVKEALKAGEALTWAHLEQGESLRIR